MAVISNEDLHGSTETLFRRGRGRLQGCVAEAKDSLWLRGELGGAAGAAGLRQSRDFGCHFVREEHERAGCRARRYFSRQPGQGEGAFRRSKCGRLGTRPIDSKLLFHGPNAFEQLAASSGCGFDSDIDASVLSCAASRMRRSRRASMFTARSRWASMWHRRSRRWRSGSGGRPQSLDVGFQIRSAPPFVAIVRRIQSGAIWEVARLPLTTTLRRRLEPDRPARCLHDEFGCGTGFGIGPCPGHPGRAEHSCHRHLQLDAEGASGEGDGYGRT